ncbi:MAG: hypothetical protein IPN69_08465 [Acidobacteria bacterium]|nr:hypothetical protein [Acidobacteriota bacterium]
MANVSYTAEQLMPKPVTSAVPKSDPTKVDPTKAVAEKWTVDDNQLVEKRLPGLLSSDNPIVQMGQTKGLQQANARGLLNSSMAAESGAKAAYDYAMPIATQDASTYANSARENANLGTGVSQANAQLETSKQVAAGNNAAQLAAAGISANSAQTIAKLNSDTQIKLQKMDAGEQADYANLDIGKFYFHRRNQPLGANRR